MSQDKRVSIVIPARFASSRFPGKPLARIAGQLMIERVYNQARKCKLANSIVVATDDEQIKTAVEAFGGEVIMTSTQHATGTDRLAEVAQRNSEIDIVVNVQGDEPLICPEAIDSVIAPLLADESIEMSTMAFPLQEIEEIESPQIPKVVLDRHGFALYFSRHAIPYHRDRHLNTQHLSKLPHSYLGHAGLYVYRRSTLLKLAGLPLGVLEDLEKLEQLRALENGIKIKVVVRPEGSRTPAVDLPEDIAKVESFLEQMTSRV